MNIVGAGNRYTIYSDALKTYKELPTGVYDINFAPMSGFSLVEHSPLEVKEEKIYGDTPRKVTKVLKGFEMSNRNFGVILSGNKGIGKSLFARILSIEAQKRDIPVILASNYIPGIADFLQSIDQEVVVFFDEFEKAFGSNEDNNPQEELLSLFDGVDNGKKLFIITCNEVSQLNSFLLNRPGRFHYHFVLSAPTPEETREYLRDKLEPQYYDEIERVVNFSQLNALSYDILRAICFEINCGYTFAETLQDLNISKEKEMSFTLRVRLKDGSKFEEIVRINLLNSYNSSNWMYDEKRRCLNVRFSPSLIHFNPNSAEIHLPTDQVQLFWESGEDYSDNPLEALDVTLTPYSSLGPSLKYLI